MKHHPHPILALVLGLVAATTSVSAGASQEGDFEVATPGPALVVVPPSWFADGPPLVRVFGPSGAEIETSLHDRGRLAQPTEVAIRAVSRVGDGWALEVDPPAADGATGPDGTEGPCSAGLELDLGATRVVLDEVVVEGRDGSSWRQLAQGPIFRLDAAAGSQTTSLSWPPSNASRLRILLPGATSADAPDVRSIHLATCRPASEGFELALATTCQSRGSQSGGKVLECEAALPPRRITELELAFDTSAAPAADLTWRVSTGFLGRWRRLGEGLGLGRDGRLRVGLGTALDGAVRVEVSGTTAQEATLLAYGPGLVLALEAAEAGRYRVRREPGRGNTSSVSSVDARARWFHLELTPTVLPAGTPIEGAPLTGNFSTSWAVRRAANPATSPPPNTATTGEALALELSPAVLATARADLGDLRLASDGRQVPYRRETLARGAFALEAENLAPQTSGVNGTSEIELLVDEPGLPLSALELRALGPFTRSVRLVRVEPDRPGVPGGRRQLAQETFACATTGPLPCFLSLALELRSPVHLVVEIDDGDAAPLTAISARVSRRRETLVFAAPAGELHLLAGDSNLAQPRYDEVVLRRLEAPGTAELGPATATAADTSGRDRWVLLGALGIATLVLVVVLRRQLRT